MKHIVDANYLSHFAIYREFFSEVMNQRVSEIKRKKTHHRCRFWRKNTSYTVENLKKTAENKSLFLHLSIDKKGVNCREKYLKNDNKSAKNFNM